VDRNKKPVIRGQGSENRNQRTGPEDRDKRRGIRGQGSEDSVRGSVLFCEEDILA
jgi:hypothetical protein